MHVDAQLSTGLAGLDRVLRGLIPGDNLVWQVESIEDYDSFVKPFVAAASVLGKKIVYFRFARHAPLAATDPAVEVRSLFPENGFEAFIAEIHHAIERSGAGAHYVFDSLSDLAVDWYSDQMLGNFFMLTCPYIYDVKAIAYFGLLRGRHAKDASGPIMDTAQVVIDVYGHRGRLHVHPLKVQHRFSPTIHTLHERAAGDDFRPVTESATIAEIMAGVDWSGLDAAGRGLGVWNVAFTEAEKALHEIERGVRCAGDTAELLRRLLRMAVSRDERMLDLAERHLRLRDVLAIRKRMIGTGLVGGKAAGMLIARSVLKGQNPAWADRLEPHDSFYVGSDVYYTFVVRNGVWWVREKQKDPATFLDGAETARRQLLTGGFPPSVWRQFVDMLDYFGQSPIVVRSSSLLEDNYGNSFAGKYDSVFCANQGPRQKRLDDLLAAVRAIYASTMSERALTYRAHRGLLERDEQMALLVQRVSGGMHGRLFFPQAAGVALSYNPYVWSADIRPEAGVARVVFGLGTRAVERSDNDYTRIIALNAPHRRPDSSPTDARQYAQRRVDAIDLEANQLASLDFADVVRQKPRIRLETFAAREARAVHNDAGRGQGEETWRLTFEGLIDDTPFVSHMREMLEMLEKAYGASVDVEYAVNFDDEKACKINLLQCRPLQIKKGGTSVKPEEKVDVEDVLLRAHGAVIGHSRIVPVDRLVYVVPEAYSRLATADRYSVARLVGRLARLPRSRNDPDGILVLVGPGRWGTTTPSLGVPVSFGEIDAAGALCEIVVMREDLVPDVSLGTHFFNDLVELEILYVAVFPDRSGNHINTRGLEATPNRLADLLPDAAPWASVLRVIESAAVPGGIWLSANTPQQHAEIYRRSQASSKTGDNG
ncbi:MAG: pyruvate, phosphate dikinase [Vicinamibacteria bacterium]|nr:pyruvate, phosphate dikinase [Vicinamibacteria bacterium]